MDVGLYPWWTDPSLKAEFLQALTVLTHRLDYVLWPDSPTLMHAQSLFWLGAAVSLAAVFYRRMMGATGVAALAALLFAMDDARGATVGFLANRNVLVAATLGIPALIFHDRWRREGVRLAAPLSLLFLAGALFAKEEGIGTCAYLASYALFADPAGRWRGCLAILPHAGVVVAWRSIRDSWHYGVANVGLYIDPLTDPGPFARALVGRLPTLLLGQWSPIPSDASVLWRPWVFSRLWWVAVAWLAVVAIGLIPLVRRDRLARFWGAGMLFATIPVSATLPMDRLLTFTGIGASGLLAQFLALGLGRSADRPSSRLWRAYATGLAWILAAVHLVYAPLALPVRAATPLGPPRFERRLYVDIPIDADIADRTVVIVNAPSPPHAGFLMLLQELSGRPVPRHTRILAPAIPSVTIRRVDERTLAIRPEGGYLRWVLDQIFRSERRRFLAGETVRVTGMTATVTALNGDGRPAEVQFRFDTPLESPTLVWLCFRGGRFERFVPPALGRETEIRLDWDAMLGSLPSARGRLPGEPAD